MGNPPRSVSDHVNVFLILFPISISRGKQVSRTSGPPGNLRSELTEIERPGECQGDAKAGCASWEDAVGLRVEI